MNRGMQKNNKSGYTGVFRFHNKWVAAIGFNGKQIRLGAYDDIEDAIESRREAEIKYFGDYSYKNSTGHETHENIEEIP